MYIFSVFLAVLWLYSYLLSWFAASVHEVREGCRSICVRACCACVRRQKKSLFLSSVTENDNHDTDSKRVWSRVYFSPSFIFTSYIVCCVAAASLFFFFATVRVLINFKCVTCRQQNWKIADQASLVNLRAVCLLLCPRMMHVSNIVSVCGAFLPLCAKPTYNQRRHRSFSGWFRRRFYAPSNCFFTHGTGPHDKVVIFEIWPQCLLTHRSTRRRYWQDMNSVYFAVLVN